MEQSKALMRMLVNETLEEWQIYNMDPATYNVMTAEKIKESKNYVVTKIIERMTPDIKNRLSVAYIVNDYDPENPTKMSIIDSILVEANKAVLDLCIKNNRNADSAIKNLPNIQAF